MWVFVLSEWGERKGPQFSTLGKKKSTVTERIVCWGKSIKNDRKWQNGKMEINKKGVAIEQKAKCTPTNMHAFMLHTHSKRTRVKSLLGRAVSDLSRMVFVVSRSNLDGLNWNLV